jgi:hypothetical protein
MTADPQHTTESTTDSILVVLDPDDPEATLRAALRDTDPSRASYHLLLVVPRQSYEAKRRAFADAGVPRKHTIGQAKEAARQQARRVGREFFGHHSAAFTATGTVGSKREAIRQTVETHDFAETFVPTRERSLLERFLGTGDPAASLARTLPDDIDVTTVDSMTGPSGEEPETESFFDSGSESTSGSK